VYNVLCEEVYNFVFCKMS